MKKAFNRMLGACLFLFGSSVFAGDLTCYGYTSTTSHFACGSHGNCTWWAAYARPDLAAAGITGDAKYWYDNAMNLGFDVGSQPKVGAIAVFSNGTYGHVAYVKKTNSDGSFDVSEMDALGSHGFVDGVNSATYHPDSGGKYHRNNGTPNSWTLKGFIYRRESGENLYCDDINSIWGICWAPSSTDVSCQGGTDWTLYDFEQGSVIRVSTDEYCLDVGGIGGGGGTPSTPPIGTTPDPEEGDRADLYPDYDIKRNGGEISANCDDCSEKV